MEDVTPAWLARIGGRKFIFAAALALLGLLAWLAVRTELDTLFYFWLGLAGLFGAGNVGEHFARRQTRRPLPATVAPGPDDDGGWREGP